MHSEDVKEEVQEPFNFCPKWVFAAGTLIGGTILWFFDHGFFHL